MVISELKSEHIDYVKSIIINRWNVSEQEAISEIERWIVNEDNSICFVGLVNDIPIATGVFDTISDIDYTISPWNTLLWVEPEYRGNNYGKLLTEKRFLHAEKSGYKEIYLDTVSAKDYHLKIGWEIVREFYKNNDLYIIMKFNL
jgi:GNAT superfamily N-acetyltransferase